MLGKVLAEFLAPLSAPNLWPTVSLLPGHSSRGLSAPQLGPPSVLTKSPRLLGALRRPQAFVQAQASVRTHVDAPSFKPTMHSPILFPAILPPPSQAPTSLLSSLQALSLQHICLCSVTWPWSRPPGFQSHLMGPQEDLLRPTVTLPFLLKLWSRDSKVVGCSGWDP